MSGVNVGAIPAELRERVQWVLWRLEPKRGRQTKVPYRAADPSRPASSTNPATWAPFDVAYNVSDFADGVGFVFSDTDPFCGIDVDGFAEPERQRIVELLDSYTERSVNGGLHVIVAGRLNGSGRHPADVGVFDRGRYFVMTGAHVDGTPTTIEPRQAQLDRFLELYVPAVEPAAAPLPPQPIDIDDEGLLERAFASKLGPGIRDLYEGRWEGRYGSQSQADLGLLRQLAFWFGRDPARIDRVFRSSRLMRGKWLEKRGETTYGAISIAKAIAGTREVYTPPTTRSSIGASETYEPSAKEAVRMARDSTSLRSTNETKEGRKTTFDRFFRTSTESLRPLGDAAFEGLAGRVVAALAPTTEASPTALLVSLLTMFGNAVGSRPHAQVGADRHRPNLFSVLVGPSGSGRKGMAMSHAEQLLALADTDWRDRVVRGLVSGEGVIWNVRDKTVVLDDRSGAEKVSDEGVSDKRLLVREDELASVLAAMARDGSTLSGVLRDAWDGRRLQTLAKRSPAVATGAHVSVLAAITPEEALRKLTATEQANGFANRFLWVYVERSRLLPDGAAVDEPLLLALGRELGDALDRARRVDGVLRNNEANELWREVYPRLTRDVPGMTGAMRSRGEAQALRLSLCYALLDGERLIRRQHVAAALELWEYAERSLFFIFGDTLGDPAADRILVALRAAPAGLTRTEIADLFSRNAPANEIERALAVLARAGLALPTSEQTGGRPVERWHAIGDDDDQEESDG